MFQYQQTAHLDRALWQLEEMIDNAIMKLKQNEIDMKEELITEPFIFNVLDNCIFEIKPDLTALQEFKKTIKKNFIFKKAGKIRTKGKKSINISEKDTIIEIVNDIYKGDIRKALKSLKSQRDITKGQIGYENINYGELEKIITTLEAKVNQLDLKEEKEMPQSKIKEIKMAKGKEKKEVSLLDKLKDVAKDLNVVIPLDPPIDLEQSEEDLKEEIIEIANEDVAVSDKLKKSTWATLAELNVGPKVDPEEEETEEPKEEKEVAEEPAEVAEEEAPVKEAKKKSLKEPEAEKKAKKPAVKKEKKARYTRCDAVFDAIEKTKSFTKESLCDESQKLFSAKTGRTGGQNSAYNKAIHDAMIFVLVEREELSVDGKNFKKNK